jgi:hypothetical protein
MVFDWIGIEWHYYARRQRWRVRLGSFKSGKPESVLTVQQNRLF